MADKVKAKSSFPNTDSLTGDDKILALMLERYHRCQDVSSSIRRDSMDDVSFTNGRQWPDEVERERNQKKRPCLKINRLFPLVNRVVNDMRMNRPAPKVRPMSDMYVDEAEVVDGLLRSIMHNGDSKEAIDNASKYQVMCGMGFLRILTDYCDDEGFDQDIKICRIENPFSVYFPLHTIKELDYSDAEYAFIRTKISKDEFKLRWPQFDSRPYEQGGIGDVNWDDSDSIYIAEYFTVDSKSETLYLLKDGTTTTTKPKNDDIIKERETTTRKVMWYLATQYDILDRKEWPGKWIPIVPFLGQEIIDNGQKTYVSLVRFAKDAQRLYNYSFTAYQEVLAQAPRAPFMVAAKQIEGFEDIWRTSNIDNHAFLPYHPISEAGQPVPPPQKVPPPDAGNGLYQSIQLTSEQIKETTNLYDASLGSPGNETSAKAIVARQRQGDTANFHFVENQAKGIHHMGRICTDLIPTIYDSPERVIRILGPDMADKVVKINLVNPDEKGRLYNVKDGKYQMDVDVGLSYETKRLEMLQNVVNLSQTNPQLGMLISDVMVQLMDFPRSQELSDRLKRYIMQTSPGVIQENQEPGSPEETQAMIQDMHKLMQAHQATMQENGNLMQQMQQMGGTIAQLQAALKDKQAQQQMDMDKTVIKAQTEIQKAQLDHQHEANQNMMMAAIENQRLQQITRTNAKANALGGGPKIGSY